jgi:hypothetical protein
MVILSYGSSPTQAFARSRSLPPRGPRECSKATSQLTPFAQSVSATQAFAHCLTPEPRFRFFGPSSVASAQSNPRAQSFVEAHGEASALPDTERMSQMQASDSTEKPPRAAAALRGRLRAAGKILEKGNTTSRYQKTESASEPLT